MHNFFENFSYIRKKRNWMIIDAVNRNRSNRRFFCGLGCGHKLTLVSLERHQKMLVCEMNYLK